jgi:zinc transport system permease protein
MMEWLSLLAPAWVMGAILVSLTAPLGCLMLWRRMAFFADTMAHGTLLGVAIAAVLSLPFWLGVGVVSVLLVGLLWFLHDTRLPNDALLALCSSALLCCGLLLVQQIPTLRPELLSYLFGDLLSVGWTDIPVLAAATMVGVITLVITWRSQIQLATDPDIAISEGVSAGWQRLIFMLVLALFTVLALKAVGSLLMGALLVIPALTARLLSHSPTQMMIWAFVWAQIGVAAGLWSSVWLNSSTGLAIVLCMALCFATIFAAQKLPHYILARNRLFKKALNTLLMIKK